MRMTAGLLLGLIGCLLPFCAASPVPEAFSAALQAFFSRNLWLTLSTLAAVIVLESEIRALRLGERMAGRLSLLGTRASLAFVPALLGLLPAVAGARFSVGLVQALAKQTNASPETLATVNFWFRHVHLFCNPLVTGTILAGAITNLPAHRLLCYGVPLALLSAVIGWIIYIRPIQSHPRSEAPAADMQLKLSRLEALFAVAIPVSLAAALFLPGSLLLAVVPALAIGAAAAASRCGIRSLFSFLAPDGRDRRILIEVMAILWFVAAAEASGITRNIAELLLAAPLPIQGALFLCAFGITAITGQCLPSVAFVMPLACDLFPGDALTAYAVLLAGFAAQFATPAHLCLLVSADAFGVSISTMLRRMLPAIVLTSIGSAALMAGMHWLEGSF